MLKILQWFILHWRAWVSVIASLGGIGGLTKWFHDWNKEKHAQLIDSLAAKVRRETLAKGRAGGSVNVSSKQVEKILGPEHKNLAWEVMHSLEEQGHATILPIRVDGFSWEVR